jgi:hypothetical protein
VIRADIVIRHKKEAFEKNFLKALAYLNILTPKIFNNTTSSPVKRSLKKVDSLVKKAIANTLIQFNLGPSLLILDQPENQSNNK